MRTPSEAELIARAVAAGRRVIMTALPGKVVEYDPATKRATIEPTAHNGDPLPPIPDVPIKFPRGGGVRIIFHLNPGDQVTLQFYQYDPSRFRATGNVSQANTTREHGYYPIAVPGSETELDEYEAASADGLHLGTDDGTTEIVIAPGRIDLGALTSPHPVSKGDVADDNFAAIFAFLRDHVHPTAVGPTSKAGPTPTAPTLAAVASDKVFIER